MVLALQSSVSSKLDVLKWESAINSLAPQFLYTEVVGIILHLVICCTHIFLQGEGNASTTRFFPLLQALTTRGMGNFAVGRYERVYLFHSRGFPNLFLS